MDRHGTRDRSRCKRHVPGRSMAWSSNSAYATATSIFPSLVEGHAGAVVGERAASERLELFEDALPRGGVRDARGRSPRCGHDERGQRTEQRKRDHQSNSARPVATLPVPGRRMPFDFVQLPGRDGTRTGPPSRPTELAWQRPPPSCEIVARPCASAAVAVNREEHDTRPWFLDDVRVAFRVRREIPTVGILDAFRLEGTDRSLRRRRDAGQCAGLLPARGADRPGPGWRDARRLSSLRPRRRIRGRPRTVGEFQTGRYSRVSTETPNSPFP